MSKIKLLKLKEVIEKVGLGRSTIYLMMNRGEFPKPIKMGERKIYWLESDTDKFIKQRIKLSK